MDWFEKAPFYLTVWALPVVAILYVVAVIKNRLGEKYHVISSQSRRKESGE